MWFEVLCRLVGHCVEQYFITFRYCWTLILLTLIILIGRYFELLRYLIGQLVESKIALIAVTIALFFVTQMLAIIFVVSPLVLRSIT